MRATHGKLGVRPVTPARTARLAATAVQFQRNPAPGSSPAGLPLAGRQDKPLPASPHHGTAARPDRARSAGEQCQVGTRETGGVPKNTGGR
ncbi:MAG TPA: hypothetical protein VFV38_50020 [Ktedonobacteraceae bacterium]|nr:hypothetical protein [Ktedonobacteraceae bacterium]